MSKARATATKSEPPLFALLDEIALVGQLAAAAIESALPRGLSIAQHNVLKRLARGEEPPTIGELAGDFRVTQPTMSSTIRKLEDKGLVELRPQPGDRRVRRVAITRAGELAHREALDCVEGWRGDLGPMIGKARIDSVMLILGELRAKLDAARA